MSRSRWLWRARNMLAVLLLAAVAAACADHTDVGGSRVLVIGDSILAASENQVRSALEADGWQATVVGIGGIPTQGWRKGAEQYVARFHPNVAVVELGTNNCAKSPCEDIGAYIDALMHVLTKSADVVYWLNTQDLPVDHPVHADFVNREIADAAVRWPNMVVVDMNSRFENHPEWHSPDGLHFNDAGKLQLAALIRDALHDSSPAVRGTQSGS